MKTFRIGKDDEHIYFQNLKRIPLDEEVSAIILELKKAGCSVGRRQDLGLAYLHECKHGEDIDFNLVYSDLNDDGPFLYCPEKAAQAFIDSIFEHIS